MKRCLSVGIVPLSAVFLSVLCVGTLEAQLNRAALTGTVTDSSRGLVTDVDVAATNLGTTEVTRGRTNGEGIYSILNLFPGKYSLQFSKIGFAPIDVPEITLRSTQVAKFDETLAVGGITQAVEVTAEAPILESQTASIGNHITGQVMIDLPLSIGGGRNFEQFAVALTPGYSPNSNPYSGHQWQPGVHQRLHRRRHLGNGPNPGRQR